MISYLVKILGVDAHFLQTVFVERSQSAGLTINLGTRAGVVDADFSGIRHRHTVSTTISIAEGSATELEIGIIQKRQVINNRRNKCSTSYSVFPGHVPALHLILFDVLSFGVSRIFIIAISATKEFSDEKVFAVTLYVGADKAIKSFLVLVFIVTISNGQAIGYSLGENSSRNLLRSTDASRDVVSAIDGIDDDIAVVGSYVDKSRPTDIGLTRTAKHLTGNINLSLHRRRSEEHQQAYYGLFISQFLILYSSLNIAIGDHSSFNIPNSQFIFTSGLSKSTFDNWYK